MKWNNKLIWYEKEWNYVKEKYETNTYIHPILAVGSLVCVGLIGVALIVVELVFFLT